MNDVFDLPDWSQVLRVAVRLIVAVVFGGLLGFEREREGKAAGLRTHMLVALGAALFTVTAIESGMNSDNVSRVIQGIATGIGFLGAGTILKGREKQEIHGLTTAAGVWLTAAVGISVGLGQLWISGIGVVLALIILSALVYVERKLK
jgi:putative Mg2+ transporter-C (MgtC) family protein